MRQKLTPAARSAIISLSNDMRLKAEIVAIRQAIGRVRTRNEGSKCITIAPNEAKLMPRDTTKSTRRNISFVKIIKHSPTRLAQKGRRSSKKMYRSRSLINSLDGKNKMRTGVYTLICICHPTQQSPSVPPELTRKGVARGSEDGSYYAGIY